jgi:predicted nucleic acid-binding protein
VKFTCDTKVLVDVLRDPSAEEAFRVFLSRFSHLTYLSAVVILELRAEARTPKQIRLLEQEVIQRFTGVNRVFAPSADAFSAAGKLLATVATRGGWTAEAHPSSRTAKPFLTFLPHIRISKTKTCATPSRTSGSIVDRRNQE